MSFSWNSPTWGQAGANVHEDSTGSWTHVRDNDNDGDF